MAIPNAFRSWSPTTQDAWAYVFDLTTSHPTRLEMNKLKHSIDTVGEAAFARLSDLRRQEQQRSRKESEALSRENDEPGATDTYHQLKRYAHFDANLRKLWDCMNLVPAWVDWEQIARGQDVFYRYGPSFLIGLAFQSLLAGMGAARIVETLSRTGGFGTKVARRRLFETTQFVLQCTRSVESIRPGGEGFAAAIRVRLLHAAVRQKMLSLIAEDPGYYNVQQWGIPINDLDSIATITSFSSTLIWISLPRQG